MRANSSRWLGVGLVAIAGVLASARVAYYFTRERPRWKADAHYVDELVGGLEDALRARENAAFVPISTSAANATGHSLGQAFFRRSAASSDDTLDATGARPALGEYLRSDEARRRLESQGGRPELLGRAAEELERRSAESAGAR
jgi:hypothetical protein